MKNYLEIGDIVLMKNGKILTVKSLEFGLFKANEEFVFQNKKDIEKILIGYKMDEILGKLREARALILEEKSTGKDSRELSVCLTEVDTAILWRQHDLQLKHPSLNQAGPCPY